MYLVRDPFAHIEDFLRVKSWFTKTPSMEGQLRSILETLRSFDGVLLSGLPDISGGAAPDGTWIFEWRTANTSAGFVIEEDKRDSKWFFSNKKTDTKMNGDIFPTSLLPIIAVLAEDKDLKGNNICSTRYLWNTAKIQCDRCRMHGLPDGEGCSGYEHDKYGCWADHKIISKIFREIQNNREPRGERN